jgi:hypothetical protein
VLRFQFSILSHSPSVIIITTLSLSVENFLVANLVTNDEKSLIHVHFSRVPECERVGLVEMGREVLEQVSNGHNDIEKKSCYLECQRSRIKAKKGDTKAHLSPKYIDYHRVEGLPERLCGEGATIVLNQKVAARF